MAPSARSRPRRYGMRSTGRRRRRRPSRCLPRAPWCPTRRCHGPCLRPSTPRRPRRWRGRARRACRSGRTGVSRNDGRCGISSITSLAQHDLTPAALDALVAREVAAQPIGAPAQREALDLWPRYRACLAALDAQPGTVQPGTRIDPDAIAGELERRAALASRWLGDWSTPFFADAFRQQHDDLDRIRIARDPALSDAQKRERLAALDQALPPDMRDAHEQLARQREAVAAVARPDARRATPDALRAQLGADVAARVVRQRQDDDAWQARYRDYEAERERLVAQQLAPDARDAQLAQLLQRDFPDPADALRAASLGADRADITARQRAR